jgi:CheY-like chemotaxis protein
MFYKSNVSEFVDALKDLSEKGKTCTAVFFDQDGGWGKVLLVEGRICSARYNGAKGVDVLRQIKGLKRLQYQFRADEAKIAKSRQCEFEEDEFFNFFQVSVVRGDHHGHAAVASRGVAVNRKHKVLIADDSRIARKSIARILMTNGIEVVEAENGFEALGQLENEKPHLIMLDLIMPGLDGYKVLDAIRKKATYRKLPVFILTSRDSLMDKLKGRMSESDEYLTKPVDEQELMNKITTYFSRGAM